MTSDNDYTIAYLKEINNIFEIVDNLHNYISENIKSTYSYLAIYRNFTKLRMYGLEDSFHASVYMKGKVIVNGGETLKIIE